MSTQLPTYESTTALARAVRSNPLTRAQREQIAVVLGMIGSACRVAAQEVERADNPVSAAIIAGAWSPVATEFDRLLGLVTTG